MQPAEHLTRWRAIAPGAVAVAVFVLVVFLYLTTSFAIHGSLLTSWGVRPFRFPFVDADTVLSALRCRRLGVDVFSTNPCDALGRVYDYSPAWLVGTIFPVTEAWIVPVGLAVDAIFLASLFLLPPGRTWRATAAIVLGVLATPVAFALERANNDLVIFVLAVLAATLACRSQVWRLLGYACAFLAGLLKYYPMLLMALAVRERPRVFFAVATVAVLLLALFVGVEGDDLRRALSLIPTGAYDGDMFGARILPAAAAERLGLSPLVGQLGQVAMLAICLAVAIAIGLRATVAEDLACLTDRERTLLFAGALLVLGCFCTAQNIGYRAIHLLLVLPSLTALATRARARRVYALSSLVVVVLLWAEGWRHWLDGLVERRPPWVIIAPSAIDFPRTLAWLTREYCWWWTITLLLALSISLLLRSRMGLQLQRLRGKRVAPASAAP